MLVTNGLQRDRRGRLLDLYRVLGVPENASFLDIQGAYWSRAHSAGQDERRLLNTAYEVLGNQQSREEYDARLHAELQPAGSACVR